MPVPSKHDNVTFLPGRSRYSILSLQPTWVYHRMAAGQTLNGGAPERAGEAASECDPTAVAAGVAAWDSLTKGGLFTQLGNYKTSMIVEAVDNPGSATLTLVDRAGGLIRNFPTTFPARITAGETIKAVGGSAGGKVGFMVRYDADKVL
jgi:hypothetical protein